jgi:hypothetical protein
MYQKFSCILPWVIDKGKIPISPFLQPVITKRLSGVTVIFVIRADGILCD